VTVNERVKAAFMNSTLASLLAILDQRNPGPKAMGSTFLNPMNIMDLLSHVEWREFVHPSISAPAVGFITDIPGRMGVVSIDNIVHFYGNGPEVRLVDGHKTVDNPKGTGFVEAVFELGNRPINHTMTEVGFTTLLVGPRSETDPTEVVWTFFPGDPIPPSRVKDETLHGKFVSLAVAKEMGFQYVKLSR
jgi:hypothetical protein